jgi:hypothetical protein
MSLYAIQTELATIVDRLLDTPESPEVQAELTCVLEGLDAALTDKAEDYVLVIRELEARAEARTAEARRMRELAGCDMALAERLKERLKGAMEASGRLKIDTERFKISVQRNGGKVPVAIDPTAMDLWDGKFVRVKREPDADTIRQALEAGQEVVGCSLMERGTSLRVR